MASTKQFIEKRDNIAAIITYIRERGRATRMEISHALSLSWACVSDLVSLLMEEGLIAELSASSEGAREAKGRTPTCLVLDTESFFLGVDINDSGIAITEISFDGRVRAFRKWNAEPIGCESELTESCAAKITEMLAGRDGCFGIGVAMEGMRASVDTWSYPTGKSTFPYAPKRIFEERFGLPVTVRHDPECTLYSVICGRSEDAMAVRIDNGIGVAAMKEGKMLDLPLELGFITVGERKLRDILIEGAESGSYGDFARELGVAAGNLAMLLGIPKIYIVGGSIRRFYSVESDFSSALARVSSKLQYEISGVSDASEGAALLAVSEFPILPYVSKRQR